jgi:SAM-dependent methyltransferase
MFRGRHQDVMKKAGRWLLVNQLDPSGHAMNDMNRLLAYNELAWTEDWLTDPADYEDEAGGYVSLIMKNSVRIPKTMLHLGSGAGGMDRVFKRHFQITGVDVSPGMLARARTLHPDIEYVEGDMRSVRLKREFDVVAIPDSIDYMVSRDDLDKAIGTAVEHLRPGGIVLVVGKTAETFQNNNFAYAGGKNGIHITLLENNHVDPLRPDSYEAVLVYLIRQNGELFIHTDRHVLGLFSQSCWEDVFRRNGLSFSQSTINGVYDSYLLAEGEYRMQAFIGVKRGE